MRKRVLAGILAVIMAGSIMTGCAGTKKTENKSSVSGENKNKSTSEKVELTIWAGKDFIRTMVNLGKTHDKLTVVSDQIGTPTYTYDLARLLVDMIETEKYGYYHATNEGGFISWYDFTKEIFRQAAALGHKEYENVQVSPVPTAEYGVSKAVRPFNSRLDKSKLVRNGFQPLPTWQDALERYLKEIL